MEEIINSLLDKPLAFIITIGGIIFLGLSGITKAFKIEVDRKNSIRLFWAGLSLLIIGIPIYYLGDNQLSPDLDVKLLKVEFFKNDAGHICEESLIHIRETYQIKNAEGEKFTKVILSQGGIHSQDIIYQDKSGNYAINYCYNPDFERTFRTVIMSSSGKTSNIIKYKISSEDVSQIQEQAPRLVRY
ncbi:hypothetical protein IFO69_19755 [Echinicola sp. CAU 1574]|uniref:Uncharacterized protein n=1 Tax=Echinicola arenosa TaxID=2774144 RepID=A0ABR9ASY6_9BACT|nr:hypothetical protein [Echinicola arenosa]MBD8490998.1 hypothetical protein [Echinicola arenosa]